MSRQTSNFILNGEVISDVSSVQLWQGMPSRSPVVKGDGTVVEGIPDTFPHVRVTPRGGYATAFSGSDADKALYELMRCGIYKECHYQQAMHKLNELRTEFERRVVDPIKQDPK